MHASFLQDMQTWVGAWACFVHACEHSAVLTGCMQCVLACGSCISMGRQCVASA